MRVYERRRERELAGTTGSHVPTFPVDSPSVPQPRDRVVAGAERHRGRHQAARCAAQSSPTRGACLSVRGRAATRSSRPVPPSGLRPDGVWLDFNGARWYSDGAAESFSPDRFEPMGEYHGFPVYRDKQQRQRRDLGGGGEGRPAGAVQEIVKGPATA